jgi:hypothetical protein
MTLRFRRITYIIFIIIFLVVTPAIILYAAGYRYNFQKHRLQKTGILILKSRPEGARIYLSGDLQKSNTPAHLANLVPEDYLIKIEKEGFYPWQKTLPVRSRTTTFAENVTLFKKNLPTDLTDGDIPLSVLSPDREKIVYLLENETNKEVWLLNLKDNKKNLLYGTSSGDSLSRSSLEWSHNGQKILITITDKSFKAKYIVFDYRTQAATTYKDLNEFYFEFSGVAKKNELGFTALEDFSFLPGSSNLLAVLNKKIQDLKIWNIDSGDLIFETEADSAAWSKNGDKILYTKNFEVWFYNLSSEQEILITRYSKEIKKIGWINDNYILALLDNTLKAIELDERDQRNVTDLLELEDIKDFDIDPAGQKIYFIGSLGSKKGVFELPY